MSRARAERYRSRAERRRSCVRPATSAATSPGPGGDLRGHRRSQSRPRAYRCPPLHSGNRRSAVRPARRKARHGENSLVRERFRRSKWHHRTVGAVGIRYRKVGLVGNQGAELVVNHHAVPEQKAPPIGRPRCAAGADDVCRVVAAARRAFDLQVPLARAVGLDRRNPRAARTVGGVCDPPVAAWKCRLRARHRVPARQHTREQRRGDNPDQPPLCEHRDARPAPPAAAARAGHGHGPGTPWQLIRLGLIVQKTVES